MSQWILTNDCETRARNLLTENEKFLRDKHPSMFKTLIDCESKSYGLELLIQETAHMEDLGASNVKTL